MNAYSTLLAIAPELSSIPPERLEMIISLAAKSVGSVFGDSQDLATAYLAAHMLTTGGGGGYSGAVKSVKEGDLAITYADNGKSGSSYASTSYGMEFLRLRSECVFPALTRTI